MTSNFSAFEVTGDPADLPPGAKLIELNITESVEAAGRAIHAEIKREKDPEWEGIPALEKHHYMELGLAVVHALVGVGWHTPGMHDAIKAAAEEDAPKTGMDPR